MMPIPGYIRGGRFYPIMAGGSQEADAETQPADAASPETPTPQEQPVELSGPWAKDLERAFQDPQVRAQVHQFMAESYQPYVTRLESEKAELAQQAEVLDALREDPVGALVELSTVLGGEELAELVQQHLTPAQQEEFAEEMEDQSQQLDPRIEQMLEDWEAQKTEEFYQQELERIGATDVDRELLDPFVLAYQGDVEAGYKAYQEYVERLRREAGAKVDDAAPSAPGVMGSDSSSPPSPTSATMPRSLDEALDSLVSDLRGSAPQPVGT